jgi:hypothetical protein
MGLRYLFSVKEEVIERSGMMSCTAIVRRRLAERIVAGDEVHPQLRSLAGLRQDFYDNQGRRLAEMDTSISVEDVDIQVNHYLDGSDEDGNSITGFTIDMQNITAMLAMPLSPGTHQHLHEVKEECEVQIEVKRTEAKTDARAFQEMLKENAEQAYEFAKEVRNLALMHADDTAPEKMNCGQLVQPNDATAGDVNGNGIDDEEEVARCADSLTSGHMAMDPHEQKELEGVMQGKKTFGNFILEHVPNLGNLTLFDEMKKAAQDVPIDCYQVCANGLFAGKGMGGGFYFDGEAATTVGPTTDGSHQCTVSECETLGTHGDPELLNQGMLFNAQNQRRRMKEKRRLAIKERRRLEEKECMKIDGEDYCAQEVSAAQQAADEWEVNGVRYFVPAMNSGQRRLSRRRGLLAKVDSKHGSSPRKIMSRNKAKKKMQSRQKRRRNRRGHN